jgi:hypothetical protein
VNRFGFQASRKTVKIAIGPDRGKFLIEAEAVAEYLATIGKKQLDQSRCEVTNAIRETDIDRLSALSNSPGKGWPDLLENPGPYSFRRNVTSSTD